MSKTKREPLTSLEDIRDDCIGVVFNSKQSFKQVHEKGGPTPATISKWLYRETRFPQLATVRAMLKACDHDLAILPNGEFQPRRFSHEGIEYPREQKPRARTKRAQAKAAAQGKRVTKTVRASVKRKAATAS